MDKRTLKISLKKPSLLLAFYVASTTFFQPVVGQTLKDVVAKTLRSNPELLAALNRQLAEQQKVIQAKGDYYPKLDFDAGVGRESSNNPRTRPGSNALTRKEAGLSLTQRLYDGFETRQKVAQQELQAESSRYQSRDTLETLLFQVAENFLNVLRQTDLISLGQENQRAHQKLQEQINSRSNAGVGNRSDSQQAQGRLALANSMLVSAEGNKQEADIQFERAVGHLPQDLSKPEPLCCGQLPASLEEAVKTALQQNPKIRKLVMEYEAAVAQQQGAKAAFHPKVNLESSVQRNQNLDGLSGSDSENQLMLRMRYNAYQGGSDRAQLQQSAMLSTQALEKVRRAKREIEENTRIAWNQLVSAQQQIPVFKQRATSVDAARQAYRKQFRIGQRTLLDLLDTEREYYSAQSDLVNAEYDDQILRYKLLASMGALNRALVDSAAVVTKSSQP